MTHREIHVTASLFQSLVTVRVTAPRTWLEGMGAQRSVTSSTSTSKKTLSTMYTGSIMSLLQGARAAARQGQK
jgi:hypothetical protein